MALERHTYSIEVGGKELTLEISPLAGQANAAVLGKYGETIVLATVVMSNRDTDKDYLPLRVDYEERFYAAGKILGSRFMRREGRPSEDAILTGRLVDRTLRPLFDYRLRRDVQVVVTVVSYDEENDPDFVGLAAASLALGLSEVPWNGPVAGARVGKISGKLVVNPDNSHTCGEGCSFHAFASGPKDKINMIELEGRETQEDEVMEAFDLAQKEINRLIDFQNDIIKKHGKTKAEVVLDEANPELKKLAKEFLGDKLPEAFYHPLKLEQQSRLGVLKHEYFEYLKGQWETTHPEEHLEGAVLDRLFEEEIDELLHVGVLKSDKRPDGRKLDEVRALEGEVGLFNRTHGSSLFMRGNTQALVVTTLGPLGQGQLIETMEETSTRRFLLHYNFPPYSVGEIGMFRGPGRREIGHGALATKAVKNLIPPMEKFPYTIRVVSEITSSNGSSSMATVCGTSMALMDAGVPIPKAVAGIAMGMVSDEKGNFKVLTDIQGPEDHHGDMDFKVAGTKDGVTAVQLDTKIEGLNREMIKATLADAKKARLHILTFMNTIIAEPKKNLSPFAPKVGFIQIDPEKIGMVIGPGGKMINGLIATHKLTGIDIEDDGKVFVSADTQEKVDKVTAAIASLTHEYKIGDIVSGNIIKILEFGAIVDLGGGRDGMIHVSELRDGFVKNVTDVVKEGDFVQAKVIKVEDGRIGLSIKQLTTK
ncbi:MAG: polyribonucleotide nucleotidyltransferase [Anaplasmataceae bacterium]|nr:polyribonucleotide nucleotidyltransferase [Anaplasmataceae bacterium]